MFGGEWRLAARFRSWPISAYLLVLALATSIPITACAGFLAYHFVAESSQSRKVEYEDRLRLMRNATELRVANIIEDLQILALSPLLAAGRFDEFRSHAVDTVKLIGGVAIALYEPDGQQLVNTRLDPGTPLPKRTAFDAERRAIETGRPQVSGLQQAVVDGQPIVTIAVPVRIAGQIRYALNVGLSPRYLSTLMDDYVSGGLVGSIIDQQGILLARRPLLDGDDLIGQPTIPAVRSHVGQVSAWWIKAISRSGVATYTSLLRSDQSGWTVNLALPREAIDGPLHRFLAEFSDLERYVSGLQNGVVSQTIGRIAEVNRMKQVLHLVGGELASALRQQRDLLDEINHRVKNTLGTVQSIARLSRSSASDVDHYVAAFEGRILALSEAYNLLTENNWVGADVRAIVERTLAPYAGPDRLTISGPSLLLPPKLTLALSATIQELSTNAAKYGAFSTPSGKLEIAWTGQESGIVRLIWIERDGPLVSKPTRRGFGTKMITRMFGAETGWSVNLDFDPDGLRCTMQFGVEADDEKDVRLTG